MNEEVVVGPMIPPVAIPEETRPSPPAIYKAISAVQKEVAAIGASKNRQGPGWKFRGIEDVYELASVTMPKHGLISILEYGEPKITNYQARNGGAMVNVVIKLFVRFVAVEDGSRVTMCFYGEGSDNSDKAVNKAMTDAQKYAFFQAFWVPYAAVEDPDYEKVDRAAQTPTDTNVQGSHKNPYAGIQNVYPAGNIDPPPPPAPAPEVWETDHAPTPAVPLEDDNDKLKLAFEELRARVASSKSTDELDTILRTNAKLMAALKERKPESHGRISKTIEYRRRQIEGIR